MEEVIADFDEGIRETYLIHGITGSGKTEVYIRLIQEVVARGKQAIVLIPEIALTYQTLMRFYKHFGDRVSVLNSSLSAGEKSLLEEIAGVVSDLDEVLMCVRKMVSRDQTEKLFWVETDPRSAHNFTTIHSRSYRIAEKLNRLLFNKKESVILTSATLTVQNSFSDIKKELGLAGKRVKEQRIPSPFRYHEQVQLMVPNDLPAVNTGDDAEYIAAIAEHIISIAEVTAGRMLVLFTSHEMLRNTYGMIKESGLLEEYVLIAQGITAGSRSRLTRNFQKFEKAILFGTSSFWEGVDIPGEDLSCLIMVRLPFSHPEDPL